ncbi:carboxylating nicotinate-nucleotide diphosphorylase [Sediminicurvatus halobius]|uniref:Probable nicotinate-nucleotide pyrophosphorylase [carboxylating] n=1 Tax=Sediminicurvatus halobius TaxID=2182432 RepID=A0A2U2N7U5_9GAMM|nr:carboxylating nicotinate-nucleotide diphosphorylase [Spiribacter halobius]PWG65137.1 carboxylating nicotinate-nucleotide diphosphorylase [Spiribacter halobius]UEX78915.1 carboxylating nicotinate-nucleotide diphosphorylase [Spiribacter halobius]
MDPIDPARVADDARRALAEDVGTGDLTAALLPEAGTARARVIAREPAVVCGRPWFDAVYAALDRRIAVRWHVGEGERVAADSLLCELTGPPRPLVSGERSALNFLQFLSGTATVARRYADAVAGTSTRILDTRKTLPGLRYAQKYATRCGGCQNHRMGLHDAVLIKENHVIAAGSLTAAIRQALALYPGRPVEAEVETLAELDEALAAGAPRLLLDNFSLADTREAVRRARGRATLESSGNLELSDLPALAEAGVDFISIGALTKHVRAIDLSMRFELP